MQNGRSAPQRDCSGFHCKFDALDMCRLDGKLCNGADNDKPGFHCRHYSDEIREQLGCVLCGLACKMNRE